MEDVGNIVTAECVVPEVTKAWKRWCTIELVLGQSENVLVIILADRPSVIGQEI